MQFASIRIVTADVDRLARFYEELTGVPAVRPAPVFAQFEVGGGTLATVLTQLKYHGAVAACGLAGGAKLEATVIPFLLRGVNLLGIDSVMCPPARRREAWARLARDLPLDLLDGMTSEVKLAELPGLAKEILAGKVRGRVVVDVN